MGSTQQMSKEMGRRLVEHSGRAAQQGEAEVTHRIPQSGRSEYATAENLRDLFREDSDRLHLLSFLLTADIEKAQRCFVAGLEDCADGNTVFREWATSWARRVIARNAIRIIAPHKGQPQPTESAYQPAGKRGVLEMPVQDVPFVSILRLNDFERFVYVLSVIERFGDQECAVLLGVSWKEMRETRALAVQHVSDFERAITELIADASSTGNR